MGAKRPFMLLFLVGLCLVGCELEFQRKYPRAVTFAPDNITEMGATFHGEIENESNEKIIAHGFAWGVGAGFPSRLPFFINLGEFQKGKFNANIRSALNNKVPITVCAFVQTAEYKVYGEPMTFESLGSTGPVLNDFSPKALKPYDTLTLYGANFVSGLVHIFSADSRFYSGYVFDARDTIAKTVVPYDAQGIYSLKLTIDGQDAAFPQPLEVNLPYWSSLADFPGQPRANSFSFSIGGKGYMGTGTNVSTILSDFWEYNPVSDQWTQLPDFPGGPRTSASCFVIDGKAYVGLGHAGVLWSDSRADLWEFDPQTSGWTLKASYPGGERWNTIAFSVGSKGYVGGGKNNIGLPTNDFWEYDPQSNGWSGKANLPIYIVDSRPANYGSMSEGTYFGENSARTYSPVTNSWNSATTPYPIYSEGWSSMVFENMVILLGSENYRITQGVESMMQFPYYGPYRTGGFCFVINGKGYIGLGSSGNPSIMNPDVLKLDPSKF